MGKVTVARSTEELLDPADRLLDFSSYDFAPCSTPEEFPEVKLARQRATAARPARVYEDVERESSNGGSAAVQKEE